ncbi:hypothetical protein VCRA2116O29_30072 [Vibrio crassostreae]|nr:hypothetical protein VCRA2116O29_30072 [Vibrio crassostreae]CAK2523760.1 hypothetical protein VCRA2119O48_50071 [Vibrio crassostreae]CAK3969818.1 hypothetical protein VCRA212O16_40096 [Vibrio crassostreae]
MLPSKDSILNDVSITLVQLEVEYKNKQKNLALVSDLLDAQASSVTLLCYQNCSLRVTSLTKRQKFMS